MIIASQRLIAVSRSRDVDHLPRSTRCLPSLPHTRRSRTVRSIRPGAGLKNDWVTALLVALQLVMLVLLVTGQIR